MLKNEGKISEKIIECEKLNKLSNIINRNGINFMRKRLQKNPNVYERSCCKTNQLSVYNQSLSIRTVILSVYNLYRYINRLYL